MHHPPELLLDVFNFLPKTELEKSQLVTTNWNYLIQQNTQILPLRLFPELTIWTQYVQKEDKSLLHDPYIELNFRLRTYTIPMTTLKYTGSNLEIIQSLKSGIIGMMTDETREADGIEIAKILKEKVGEPLRVVNYKAGRRGMIRDYSVILGKRFWINKWILKYGTHTAQAFSM